VASFTIDDFLAETDAQEIDWVRPTGAPTALNPLRVDIGFGPDALEIALATSEKSPRMDDVRRLWSLRWNRRAAPVLLVVAHEGTSGWEATVCGPSGDPTAIAGLDLSQVERICAAALKEPNASAAKRTLQHLLSGPKDQLIAGLSNQGLFASHELRHGVPARTDWASARNTGRPLLGKSGTDLISSLGYTTTAHGSLAQVLSTSGHRHALAVLLTEDEVFDRPGHRFGAVSPVSQGLALAQEQGLPWLIVIRGTQMRLYPAKPDIGVGRKGQSETYVELNLALLTDEDAGYLPLLFGPAALGEQGTVAEILAASVNHAAALATRLRDRVYIDVVPALAVAVANQMKADLGRELDENDLHEAYHRTLIILFRLLFVAYAEDRGLLPYQRNPRYDKKALKTLAREFTDSNNYEFDAHSYDRWDDLLAVWRAVDDGNKEWDVPAYNGGLFAADEYHTSGHAIGQMRLTNAEIGPALKALLIDTGVDGDLGPVDFRSLSVREFGTIYEGLLESSLSVAPTDLTVDPETKAYLPAKAGSPVVVEEGQVYFHNASGARKATGSYFTKAFAVEHLLDTALEPAITAHLTLVEVLLEAGDAAGAAEQFFDFRVADLAMGSGHFLVAAIDRIENRFAKFLTENPIPAVSDELTRLAQAAAEALGDAVEHVEIEPSMLLRRQIARRCIYGLDLNLMAVELARLGIWIHTFVPGLPMSSLDHGLVVGNSLTGVGTVDEALSVFEPKAAVGQFSLFGEQITDALGVARDRLLRVARTAEATKAEVRDANRAHAKAMDDAADAKALLDAAVVIRLGEAVLPAGPDEATELGKSELVTSRVNLLNAAHMPYLFPEVFLRENGGFDVVLGNPPWEKLQVEEHSFYSLSYPGLRGLTQEGAEQELAKIRQERPDLVHAYDLETTQVQGVKSALARGPYPGLNTGRPDLYKAFAWRMWHLVRTNGRVGVVLPRKALEASGMREWRLALLAQGTFTDVTVVTNTNGWVFDEVHGQYTVGLLAIRADRTTAAKDLAVRGPFASLDEFRAGMAAPASPIDVTSLLEWSPSGAFPLLPDADSLGVFLKLRAHPRLDSTRADMAVRGLREWNATDDKHRFVFTSSGTGLIPVYKGDSFDLWNPETGSVYAYANPTQMQADLQARRLNQIRLKRSALYGMPAAWGGDVKTLPMHHPRIAWRDTTNRTNTRTVVTALVPPEIVMVHQAYYLFFREGNAATQAFVLGMWSSIPLDWYARQMVESHATVEFMLGTPIPDVSPVNPARRRITNIAGRLAAVDDRYESWASEVGVPVGSVPDEVTKNDLINELDALAAHLYGLAREDVQRIFATFHKGWNYQPRLEATLAHYDAWKAKVN
jgi:hypothetical protein